MTMASLKKNALGSDDEDDLESLRLAALKSLKPKTTIETHHKPLGISHCKLQHSYNSTFGAAQTTRHHNRGFRNNPGGRGGRNGMNPRIRTNTNLISIQTIDQDEPTLGVKDVTKDTSVEISKLILPQDRYHKPLATDNTTKESSGNKFDRYDDNSDDSESDLEELVTRPVSRERKDSVEQLMDDLDNEINFLEGKAEEKSDTEEVSDKKDTNHESESESDIPAHNDTLIISETDPDLVQIELNFPEEKPAILDNSPLCKRSSSPPYKKSRSRSPFLEKPHPQKSRTRSRSRSPFFIQYKSPRRSRSPPRKVRYSPNLFPRALSPLNLNTEVLNTITMAPLSPRSAAFVLQNREILARRQMSPRRSVSREKNNRRSLTPKRRRSRSPIRRSLSPRKRSLSPRRRSNSPRRRSPHKSGVVTNKPPVHKRLGSRPNSRNVSPYLDRKTEMPTAKRKRTSRSISLSLSPSPDRNYHRRPLNETTGYVNDRNRREKRKESPKQEVKEDPVLEARRRKFETPLQMNNGIIKLKTNKAEEDQKEDEQMNEAKEQQESPEEKDFSDEEVEETEVLNLNPTLDDLWSDENSDDENEGRFKSKPSSETKKITILPFRKLTERPIPKEPLLSNDDRRDRRYRRPRRRRSRSPVKSTRREIKKDLDRLDTKPKITLEKVQAKPVEEEKKKEKSPITVKSEANKSADILKTTQKIVKRKVKIRKVETPSDSNVENIEEPEIIVEHEDEPVTNKEDDGGDLRAELSRRRAQRLIKAGSLAESLPTRLLKNALQEVVPKRSTLKQSKLTKGNGSSADRRVRIVQRLASSPASQLEPAIKVTKKEGKLPIHMRLGSNPDVEEPVRVERKAKRPRPSRRKKQVQV